MRGMRKLYFLFLALPCFAAAQYNNGYDVVRLAKTVKFISFERSADGTVLDIRAQDNTGKVYAFVVPDLHQYLTEQDVVSPVSWCVIVSSRLNVVGVNHIGECTREELSRGNSNYFIGTDEMKRSLSQQK